MRKRGWAPRAAGEVLRVVQGRPVGPGEVGDDRRSKGLIREDQPFLGWVRVGTEREQPCVLADIRVDGR
jgi:hypothetical protein